MMSSASVMLYGMYADVIFPLKLEPLTYRIPEGLSNEIVGRIVSAPLLKSRQLGMVVSVRKELASENQKAGSFAVKDIHEVLDIFASESHLGFLKWIAQYYLAPLGVVMKSAYFSDVIAPAPKRRLKTKEKIPAAEHLEIALPADIVRKASAIAARNRYGAMLYHAPDTNTEIAVLVAALKEIAQESRGISIIVPERGYIDRIEPLLFEIFGERLAVLHGKLTKAATAAIVKNISAGLSDIVLGTRSAILAPLPKVSFAAVIEEHSPVYKAEEGARYNARDLAVMRAYIDKSSILLMSVCPSLETIHNVQTGKYTALAPVPSTDTPRPRVRIMPFSTKKQNSISLSSEVLTELKVRIHRHERILLLAGRKGYSMVRCEDCGHIASCSKCHTAMVLYKSSGMIKCHHCANEKRPSDICEECGSGSIKPLSAGTERIREDVESLIKAQLARDEKAAISQGDSAALAEKSPALTDFEPFVIGTPSAIKKGSAQTRYNAAVVLNMDLIISRPDYRAHERAFQEMLDIAQIVEPGGMIFIQTRSASSKILRCMKNYDFDTFYALETAQRKELAYPPFERMILFAIHSKNAGHSFDNVWRSARIIKDEALTVMGPLETAPLLKGYCRCLNVVMKSADSRRLHTKAEAFLRAIERDKLLKIIADVDPLNI